MGFLGFLKKGKREDVRENSLEIPLPPTMADDLGDISDLPNLTDDKEQGVPLPPLEPLDTIDQKYFDDFKGKQEFKDISRQYSQLPPVEGQAAAPDGLKFDYNPFKEEMLRRQKSVKAEVPRIPVSRDRFVRAEHFGTIVRNIDDLKNASELNKSLVSLKRIKASSDKEFDRLHRSFEDAQRSLFYVDQELFEER